MTTNANKYMPLPGESLSDYTVRMEILLIPIGAQLVSLSPEVDISQLPNYDFPSTGSATDCYNTMMIPLFKGIQVWFEQYVFETLGPALAQSILDDINIPPASTPTIDD